MKRNLLGASIILAICLLFITIVPTQAWVPRDAGGLDINEPAGAFPGDINAKLALTQRHLAVRNKSASSIAQGEPVAIDGTAIEVVASASAADNMTIAESLATEYGAHTLMIAADEAQHAVLTGTITGTDENGNVQAETISTTAVEWRVKSSRFWETITDVDLANLQGSVTVYAYPINGITDAASNSLVFVGIPTAAIADNAEGSVATALGSVVLAKVKGPDVIPGDVLSCDGSQALDEDNTAPVAIALEPTISITGELMRVLLLRASD